MGLGWIMTFAADAQTTPQISIAAEGGAGTPVPDISIEVDKLGEVHQRAVAAGLRIEYGPTTESWSVRRFYVRDPFGRLVNILAISERSLPANVRPDLAEGGDGVLDRSCCPTVMRDRPIILWR